MRAAGVGLIEARGCGDGETLRGRHVGHAGTQRVPPPPASGARRARSPACGRSTSTRSTSAPIDRTPRRCCASSARGEQAALRAGAFGAMQRPETVSGARRGFVRSPARLAALTAVGPRGGKRGRAASRLRRRLAAPLAVTTRVEPQQVTIGTPFRYTIRVESGERGGVVRAAARGPCRRLPDRRFRRRAGKAGRRQARRRALVRSGRLRGRRQARSRAAPCSYRVAGSELRPGRGSRRADHRREPAAAQRRRRHGERRPRHQGARCAVPRDYASAGWGWPPSPGGAAGRSVLYWLRRTGAPRRRRRRRHGRRTRWHWRR